MKKSKFKRLAVAAVAVCMAVPVLCAPVSACGGDGGDNGDVVAPVVTVTAITLNTDNVKKAFAYGEQFSTAGLTVTAQLSDGTTQNIPLGSCTVSNPDMKVPGTKKITVKYKNVTATYQITVAERILPNISPKSLLDIKGEKPNDSFRIETEAIDYEVSGVKAVDGKTLINSFEEGGEEKYLANHGVAGNYFGFTFTAEHEYVNANIVFRVANPTTKPLGIGTNMNAYLNYNGYENPGMLDIKDIAVLPAGKLPETESGDGEAAEKPEVELVWEDRILRNVTIPKGTNTLTFEVLGDDVVAMDYIEIYIGKLYGSNNATVLNGVGTVIKDVENFDLEKIVVREDIKNAHGLQDGQAFVERPSVNGANTHGGQSVGAMVAPTELTTVLRVEENATVHIRYTIASVDGYNLKDNYEFYLDGNKIENVQDYFIKAGDPWRQGQQFWEWRDVSIGYFDLEAGDHLFSVKVVGKDCNCDCFKFDVVSYGEYVQHPAAYADANVNALGTYVFEGENADSFYKDGEGKIQHRINSRPDFITENKVNGDGYYCISDAADCSGGRYIYGFTTGSQFTYTLYAWDDATLDINMRAVRTDEGSALVKDTVSVKLNDTAVGIPAASQEIDIQGSEWKTVTLAEGVKLKAGELYTFTLEVTGEYFNLDAITFVTTEYNGEAPAFGGIELDTSAVKKEYETGDTFSADGLKVTAVQTNGVRNEVDLNDCTVTGYDTAVHGEQTVTVSYTEGDVTKSATFTIKVYAPIQSLTLDTDKVKKEYKVGENLNTDNIKVTANLSDGTTREIKISDCTVTADLTEVGERTVEISFNGKTQSYTVTVSANLALTAQGGTVQAEDLDLSGIITNGEPNTEHWSANGQSGFSLRSIKTGSVLKLSVHAEETVTLNFKAVMSKYEAFDVADMFTLTIDGETVTVPSLVLGGTEGNQFFNWKNVDFGDIEFTAGTHVIVFTFIDNGPNIDCFIFGAAEAQA